MSDGGAVWIWTTAILAVSVGFAVGFLVAYFAVLRDKDSSGLRQELAQQKEQFEAYRARVDDHFVKTSELFQGMTRQYGALYAHLADGAQSLCSDRLVTHQPSVPESTPMVEHKVGASQPPHPGTAAATVAAGAPEPESTAEPAPQPAAPSADTPSAAQAELKPDAGAVQAETPAPEASAEPRPDPAAPAAESRADTQTPAERRKAAAATAIDDTELESFAPRPEAARLHEQSAAQQGETAEHPEGQKPRLH